MLVIKLPKRRSSCCFPFVPCNPCCSTIFKLQSAKQIIATYDWIHSHTDEDEKERQKLPAWTHRRHIEGSARADEESVRDAKHCRPGLNITKHYLRMFNLVPRFQSRYVATLEHLAQRKLPSDLRPDLKSLPRTKFLSLSKPCFAVQQNTQSLLVNAWFLVRFVVTVFLHPTMTA